MKKRENNGGCMNRLSKPKMKLCALGMTGIITMSSLAFSIYNVPIIHPSIYNSNKILTYTREKRK